MRILVLTFCWIAIIGAGAVTTADAQSRSRMGTPMKVMRYAQQLVEQYDDDGDGQLSEDEWSRMQGTPRLADRNRDGLITVAEMTDHISRFGRRLRIRLMPAPESELDSFPSLLKPQEGSQRNGLTKPATAAEGNFPPGRPRGSSNASRAANDKLRAKKFFVPSTRLPMGLPSWFRISDLDGDAQLSLAEFAPDGEASAVKEFSRYDLNSDGIMTAQEALRASRMPVSRSRGEIEADMEEAPGLIDEEPAESGPEEPSSPAAARSTKSARDKAELKKRKRTQREDREEPD